MSRTQWDHGTVFYCEKKGVIAYRWNEATREWDSCEEELVPSMIESFFAKLGDQDSASLLAAPEMAAGQFVPIEMPQRKTLWQRFCDYWKQEVPAPFGLSL